MSETQPVVLCIDDDPDFIDSTRLILESNGYRVEAASSAEEGLRAYKKNRPDAVLVDLMMEEVDAGVNFVKEIKAIGSPPPIFMLSAVGDNLAASMDYAQLGLAGVLQKPVNPERLLTTLGKRLRTA